MEYDNTNSGVLFNNKNKTTDKQPDYRGTLDVEGVMYDMAGWIKTSKSSGKKFLSIKISIPKPKPEVEPVPPSNEFDGKDIPF